MVYTVWLCYIVLSILKNLCGVFHFYIFQPSILLVALCVGEIRESSPGSGGVGHYSFHIFLTSACVMWSASFLLFCLHLFAPSLLFSRVIVFTLFTPSVPTFVSSSVERKTVCVDPPANFLSPLRNEPSVCSDLFMFLPSRSALAFLP